MKPIDQQIILVTGATDGIGRIAAAKLARMGATLLIHGRNREKCEETLGEIRRQSGNNNLWSYVRDLSSLAEVRGLAEDILSDFNNLHVLINNAGVFPRQGQADRRPVSRDGHELGLAVNFLAPFLLSNLLLPALRRDPPARIVNVSSAAQQRIDFDNVMLEDGYEPYRAYAQSKLALAMFTFELAGRLAADRITVNCLHPGSLLDTKMVREGGYKARGDAKSGADVEVYVATDPGLETVTGQYFDRREIARAHDQAYDPEDRQKVWRLGERLTGISAMPG